MQTIDSKKLGNNTESSRDSKTKNFKIELRRPGNFGEDDCLMGSLLFTATSRIMRKI